MANTILSGGVSILNMANSLLDNGRAIYARNGGPGISARSRAQLESFMNGGTALFNQLYANAEGAELANQVKILALRSQNRSLVADGVFEDSSVPASTTTGTQVDTEA